MNPASLAQKGLALKSAEFTLSCPWDVDDLDQQMLIQLLIGKNKNRIIKEHKKPALSRLFVYRFNT